MKKLNKLGRLTREEESDLALRWQNNGDKKAMQELVSRNMPLVFFLAEKFLKTGRIFLPDLFDELTQEGALALIRATSKFDTNRGVRFGTYAGFWIHSSFQRCAALKLFRRHQLDSRHLLEGDFVEAVFERDNTRWAAEASGDMPDKSVAKKLDILLVLDILKNLTPFERRVLEMRFGLGDEQPAVLAEIGAVFGVSREWIRQTEAIALRKLRCLLPTRSRMSVAS